MKATFALFRIGCFEFYMSDSVAGASRLNGDDAEIFPLRFFAPGENGGPVVILPFSRKNRFHDVIDLSLRVSGVTRTEKLLGHRDVPLA